MGKARLIGVDYSATFQAQDRPVAYLFGLPLMAREAHAFSNIEAGHPSEDDREVMRAWKVKMVLTHGSWVTDSMDFN